MRNLIFIPVVLLGLSLSGCAAVEAWIGQSVDEARAAKDIEAEVLSSGLCAMGIGALNRRYGMDQEKKAAVELLCYGQPPEPQPPTLDSETVKVLRLLLDLRSPE